MAFPSTRRYRGARLTGPRWLKEAYRAVFVLVNLACVFTSAFTYGASQYEGERNFYGRYEGHGKLTQANGKVYEGQWLDGQRHGSGTQVWSNGERYSGGWRHNKPHGQGSKIFENGDRYEGQWVNGDIHGLGVLQTAAGDVYSGEFVANRFHGKGKLARSNGDVLSGDWQNNRLHGLGVASYADGSRYWGEYKWGQRHGEGEIQFPKGGSYRGDFNNDKIQGQGVYHYSNGDVYKGQLKAGLRHGSGLLTDQRGNSYRGQWSRNLKSGRGEEHLAVGETYVGEFETGLRHGKGLLTDQQGHEYEGFWRRGQLQGEAVVTFANGKTFAGNFSDGLAHGLGECSDGETIFKCEYQQGRLLPRVVAKIDEIKIAHDIGENDVARPQTPIFNSSQTQLPVNNDKQTEAVESYLSYEHDFSDQSLHHDDAAISVIRNINEGDFQIIARSGEHWIRLYLPQFSGAGVYQLSGEQASAGRGRDESFSSSDEFPGLLRVRELSEGVLVGQFEFFAYGDGENPAVETQHIRKGHFLIDRGKIQQYEKSFTSDIADVSSPLP